MQDEKFHEYVRRTLSKYSISSLYHISDISNLKSIGRYKHLFSWFFCICNGILIQTPGGNELSRSLDMRYGLENYVRLSFTESNPMIEYCYRKKRIPNPVTLEFSTDILFNDDVLFCPINATDNKALRLIGRTKDIFSEIRFDIIKKGFFLNNDEKKYLQAEILIPTKLSLEYLIRKPYYWRGANG